MTFKLQDNEIHPQHGLEQQDAKSESTYGKDALCLKATQIQNFFFFLNSHTAGFEEAAEAQFLSEPVHLTALTKLLMHVHVILKHGQGQMPPFPVALQKSAKEMAFQKPLI